MKPKLAGHLAALATVLIWGTTFISTKVLLLSFAPLEILFLRFLLGFLALLAANPRRLRGTTAKQEGTFAAAGLCGICLYYLLENVALLYTSAANVGVILSAAPFFTAILTRWQGGRQRLGGGFLAGFAVAMAGICLLSFGGTAMHLNWRGDLLAVAAAFVWACYSLLSRRISGFGLDTIRTTRRVFAYGLVWMLPALPAGGGLSHAVRLADPVCLANLLFLGLGASALCFVTWNLAVSRLGAVRTSVYIYLVPVVTVVTAALVLGEAVTPVSAAGTALTLAGLLLSQYKRKEEDHGDSE